MAWRLAGPGQRRWIGAELIANALWLALVAAADNAMLRYHLLAMWPGNA